MAVQAILDGQQDEQVGVLVRGCIPGAAMDTGGSVVEMAKGAYPYESI